MSGKNYSPAGIGRAFLPVLLYFVSSAAALTALQMAAGADALWVSTAATGIAGSLCLAVYLPVYFRERHRTAANPGTKVGQRYFRCFVWLFCGGIYSAAAAFLMRSAGLFGYFSNETQEQLLAAPVWMKVIVLGMLAPAAEELVYRAFLFRRLRTYAGVYAAAAVSALVFAVGHGNVIQMIYALPAALILCALYQKKDSLLAPAAFHIGANLATLLLG